MAEYVERWLTKKGLSVEVQSAAPGRPNVLARIGEAGAGRTLLLEGHTDVVTEGDPAAWSHPPFEADVADGRIWGRGAADIAFTRGSLRSTRVAMRKPFTAFQLTVTPGVFAAASRQKLSISAVMAGSSGPDVSRMSSVASAAAGITLDCATPASGERTVVGVTVGGRR